MGGVEEAPSSSEFSDVDRKVATCAEEEEAVRVALRYARVAATPRAPLPSNTKTSTVAHPLVTRSPKGLGRVSEIFNVGERRASAPMDMPGRVRREMEEKEPR